MITRVRLASGEVSSKNLTELFATHPGVPNNILRVIYAILHEVPRSQDELVVISEWKSKCTEFLITHKLTPCSNFTKEQRKISEGIEYYIKEVITDAYSETDRQH